MNFAIVNLEDSIFCTSMFDSILLMVYLQCSVASKFFLLSFTYSVFVTSKASRKYCTLLQITKINKCKLDYFRLTASIYSWRVGVNAAVNVI